MNNNNHLDKFISNVESIKMTLEEKNEMRNNLASFAVSYSPVISPYHSFTLIMRRGLAVAFIAIISIGSLSDMASGQALPGDTLYPVKIAHEEIKVATTLDTKKKISYEIRRTEKRIQEATELATQNDLDSETQIEIAETIKKQTDKVQEHIEEVKEESLEEALVLNAELKSTIKVNAEALKQVSTTIKQQKKEPLVEEEITVDLGEEATISEKTDEIVDEIELIDEMPTTEIIPTEIEEEVLVENEEEIEYESVEVSFAESLLESIEKEVKDIEAFEDEVSEELIKEEVTTPIEEVETEELLVEGELDEDVEIVNIESLEEEIRSLGDIVSLREQIKEIKVRLEIHEDYFIVNEQFDETIIYTEVDVLIQERKYKKAFVLLQEVLTYYQEELINKELHLDLGIELVDPNLSSTDNQEEATELEETIVNEVNTREITLVENL